MSLDVLHSLLLHEPTKLAIIGSGCSPATEPTAEVSHYYNISTVRSTVDLFALKMLWKLLLAIIALQSEAIMAVAMRGGRGGHPSLLYVHLPTPLGKKFGLYGTLVIPFPMLWYQVEVHPQSCVLGVKYLIMNFPLQV